MLVASLSLAATPSRAQTTPSTAQTATPPPLSDGQMLEAALTQRAELPDALEVGKPLTLHLDISHPADALVQPPSDSGSTRWVLSNTSITSPPGEAAATRSTITLTLVPTRAGDAALEPLPVLVLGDAGERTILKSEPLSVKVISALTPESELKFRDARPAVSIFTVDYTPLWIGLGALGVLLLGALLVFALRMKKREEEPEIPPDMYAVAREKLRVVETSGMLEREDFEGYFTQLSEAVREYLGRRYGFPGNELTTTEIMARLKPVRWPEGINDRDIKQLLRVADRAKFAGLLPDLDTSRASLRKAYSLVELTRAPDETQESAAPAQPDEPASAKPAALERAAAPGEAEERREREETGEATEDTEDTEIAEDLHPPAADALSMVAMGGLDWDTLSKLADEPSDSEDSVHTGYPGEES